MKNLTKNADLFLLVAFILIFNSCKNKDCHDTGECPPEYYRIRLGEAKSYLYSLPGSYWIYKNTANGDLDTQVCKGFTFDSVVTKGTEPYSEHVTVEYDVIERSIESSFSHWVYFDQTISHNTNSSSYNNGRNVLHRIKGALIIPFFHPFDDGVQFGTGSSVSTCKGTVASMTVQGKTYYDVAKFDIDMDDLFINYPNTIYYWAKDVGIIKRWDKTYNNNWELIEFNIIK